MTNFICVSIGIVIGTAGLWLFGGKELEPLVMNLSMPIIIGVAAGIFVERKNKDSK